VGGFAGGGAGVMDSVGQWPHGPILGPWANRIPHTGPTPLDVLAQVHTICEQIEQNGSK